MYICRHLLWQSPVFAVSIARRGAARAPSVPARPLPAGRRIQGSGRPPRREPLPQPMSRGCMHVPLLHQARGRGRYKKPTAFDTKAKHYASQLAIVSRDQLLHAQLAELRLLATLATQIDGIKNQIHVRRYESHYVMGSRDVQLYACHGLLHHPVLQRWMEKGCQ